VLLLHAGLAEQVPLSAAPMLCRGHSIEVLNGMAEIKRPLSKEC
jgi:hypothetical protein